MRLSRRVSVAITGVVALLAATACSSGNSGAVTFNKNVVVYTWWSDGGEKAGLDGLVSAFAKACPGYSFINGAISGGAGSNAKAVLASRLKQNDPPDTFQAHAGAELSDYIKAGQVEDLSSEYKEWGLTTAFPKGLLADITVNGKIYSVPANIHRANVVWTNKTVLKDAGINKTPSTIAQFVADLDTLKSKGVKTPLAVGKDWTQEMLFEAVLISDLGAAHFTGLWNGTTDWKSSAVTHAINDYKNLLSYTNANRDSYDWTDAEGLIISGKAAFQLMGDWEAADLDSKGFKDYGWFTFPGNGNAYQWLADSFVLPKGAKDVDGAKCWLKTVGSAAGQKAFNTKKGSIPARTDANPADYWIYQQSAISDWKADIAVPSCPHGSACSQGWQAAVATAQTNFSTDGDIAALQHALAAAAARFGPKKS
jgi:glucose/mannose transport system substrate-binding protein